MADVQITINSNSHRIEACYLEDYRFNPHEHFNFVNGAWVGNFPNLPIGPDNDLDILIIVSGNPGQSSVMNVRIDGRSYGNHNTYRPFNSHGYAQFNKSLPL